MEVSPKEMRKLLNAAWEKGRWWGHIVWQYSSKSDSGRRYRDVSRILKEAEAKQRKDGRDGPIS